MNSPQEIPRTVAAFKKQVWMQPGTKKRLGPHLDETYGIRVSGLAQLDAGVFRVDRHDGPGWVARVFSKPRPIEQVEGDAEILRFLEHHGFPAERCAHGEPVSKLGEQGVLVTELAPGAHARGDNSGPTVNLLGSLLGRLHTLPAESGAPAREAGGWHHLSVQGGGRRQDVAVLVPLMDEAKARVPAEHRGLFDSLLADLQGIDLCEDLPHCLINVDFGGPNLVSSPEGPVLVDWTGSGRGPRISSVIPIMAGARDPRLVDAFVSGYREHAQLEADELERLAGALSVHSLVLDCWGFVFRNLPLPLIAATQAANRAAAESVAARAREAFAADVKVLNAWEALPPEPPMQDALQVLTNAVHAKTDDEIASFADIFGGYARLCSMVFEGMKARLRPEDCNVGFVLGESMGWVFTSKQGSMTVSKRIAKKASAIVRATPANFLRAITRELDWDTAIADGRVTVEGDVEQLTRMFGPLPE